MLSKHALHCMMRMLLQHMATDNPLLSNTMTILHIRWSTATMHLRHRDKCNASSHNRSVVNDEPMLPSCHIQGV